MKKMTLIVMLIVLTLLSTSCAQSKEADTTNESTPSETVVTETETAENDETAKVDEPVIFNDFDLIALDGTKSSLYAYEGKTIILNFWATWCGFCVQEMPLLEELNKREDIVVLAVSAGEDFETVRKYIDDNGYTFDVFVDEEGKLASEFLVQGLPTSFFIGPDFEYYFSYPGMLTEDLIDKMLEDIEAYQKEE